MVNLNILKNLLKNNIQVNIVDKSIYDIIFNTSDNEIQAVYEYLIKQYNKEIVDSTCSQIIIDHYKPDIIDSKFEDLLSKLKPTINGDSIFYMSNDEYYNYIKEILKIKNYKELIYKFYINFIINMTPKINLLIFDFLDIIKEHTKFKDDVDYIIQVFKNNYNIHTTNFTKYDILSCSFENIEKSKYNNLTNELDIDLLNIIGRHNLNIDLNNRSENLDFDSESRKCNYITWKFYDIIRYEIYIKHAYYDNIVIERLIQFLEESVSFYIENSNKLNSFALDRLNSLISIKNHLKLRYNLDNKLWDNKKLLQEFINELNFIFDNHYYSSYPEMYEKAIQDIVLIQNWSNYLKLNFNLFELYNYHMTKYSYYNYMFKPFKFIYELSDKNVESDISKYNSLSESSALYSGYVVFQKSPIIKFTENQPIKYDLKVIESSIMMYNDQYLNDKYSFMDNYFKPDFIYKDKL